MRCRSPLRWHIDADPGLDRLALPPGLLLTLVENAIQHGVEPQLEGGQIHISLNKDGAHALLRVDDNGPGPAPGQRDGVGLANCRERLVLTYGISASLTLATRPAGGCTAQVRVPLKTAA